MNIWYNVIYIGVGLGWLGWVGFNDLLSGFGETKYYPPYISTTILLSYSNINSSIFSWGGATLTRKLELR